MVHKLIQAALTLFIVSSSNIADAQLVNAPSAPSTEYQEFVRLGANRFERKLQGSQTNQTNNE